MKLYDRLNEIEKNHELQKRLRAGEYTAQIVHSVEKAIMRADARCI